MDFETLIKSHIREVADFPIDGVSFKDISPLFLDPTLLCSIQERLIEHWVGLGVNKVVGIDSRGFLFGPQLAQALNAGFVMVRKKGKLPPETVSISYDLEYGSAELESPALAIAPGDKVLIHDDLLATGGTAAAAAALAQKLGGEVLGFSFLIELTFLKGRKKIEPFSENIHYLASYHN